ncbi:MAG TPA: hypothetical protein VGP58_14205 [Pyrinomonadaceae bacterium]|nr:hypothetical protein [Pyrinomonadaceae bacterium]
MTKSKIAFSIIAFFSVCLLSLTNGFTQTSPTGKQIEPSYEVILQTLVASNSANNKSDIPQMLIGAVKRLKANYPYSNYRLGETFYQRVANTGALELRSVSNEIIPDQERSYSIFSEWTLNNLQNLPDAKGQNSIQFQSFRFGQRIPIITSSIKDANGKINSVVNYEQVGLTIQKLSLAENVPTVIASLSTWKPNELMFLVLTVKSAE